MRSKDSIDGVLLVDKASAMTSHDVVAVARGKLGIRKIGHCGTLDPMATGLLILVVGRATKIQDLLMSEDKEYEGSMRLGIVTYTQDRDGDVVEERPVADYSAEQLEEAFSQFTGEFYQIPPMVSAIKKDGVPLYKLARQGKIVEREPRLVHVFSHSILGSRLPEVDFRVLCSKGFYVRTYAHEIGNTLGCGAHLSALRRTRSGNFTLERSVSFDQLKNGPKEDIEKALISLPEVSRLRGV